MYYWLGAIIFFIIFEAITVNLTTIWFALGALCALIVSLITDSIPIQTITFLIVSIIAVIATRPFVKKFLTTNIEKTNYDRVLGMEGITTKKITKLDFGEVKVDGKLWTAKANQNIEPNTKIKVLNIDGVKLIVEKIKED